MQVSGNLNDKCIRTSSSHSIIERVILETKTLNNSLL